MKIAIPVVSDVKDTAVSDTFGRAAMFMVYDTEADASIYIQNKAALSSGGAGIQAAQTVVDSEVSVLLTPQLGSNAAKVLKAAGIRLYKAQPGLSARENLERFTQGKLEALEQIHEGFHRH